MTKKFPRLAVSSLAVFGTTFGLSALNALSPITLPGQWGQHSQQAFAQDASPQDSNVRQASPPDASPPDASPRTLSTPDTSPDPEEDINVRVYRAASPAVVAIETSTGSGSGSIITPDGLILTNAHVVSGSETVKVKLADGQEYEGDVIGYGEGGLDLAAVRIRGNRRDFPTVPVADPDTVEVGQRAFAIGSPFGLQGTFTTGIISRLDRDRGLIQTDAAINPGNSGGPLLNSRGQLIGVNSAIFSPGTTSGNVGIGFAIAADRIDPFLVTVNNGTAPTTPQQSPLLGGGAAAERLALNEEPVNVEGKLDEESNVLPSDNSYFNAYTFEGDAGQRVTIEMDSSDLNPYLILLSPEGDNIAQDDDSAGEKNSRIEVTLPTAGIYTVLANTYGSGEMGDYTLQLSTSGISPVLLKEEGTLGPDSQVLQSDGTPYQEYSFQGREGQTITILLESEDFDTFLILLGPDEQVVGQNDDASARTLNSLLTVTLPATGTYRILANAYERTGQGNFVVTVR